MCVLEGYVKDLNIVVVLDLLGKVPGSHSLGCLRDPELSVLVNTVVLFRHKTLRNPLPDSQELASFPSSPACVGSCQDTVSSSSTLLNVEHEALFFPPFLFKSRIDVSLSP